MRKILTILVLLGIFYTGTSVYAQQTIITMPSSDVIPGGEVILKQSNRFSPFGPDGFVSLTPQVIVGTGKDTEISVGAGTTIEDKTSVKMNITAKKVFRIKRSARITVGGSISPSLTEGTKPDSMIYAHGSYLIRETRTTLTAGGFVGGQGQFPTLTGAMIGIDQTIIPNKLRIVADWVSRSESWGAFAAGFKIRPEPTTSITTAVIIPNNQEDRVAFSVSISKYLGKVIELPKKEEKDAL